MYDLHPKVSVIVPVYNVEQYLRECLDSLVNQTLKEIEIICVDDCSPDRCIDILNEYKNKDSRIKIIRNEKNKGLAETRNVGMKYASGEFIAFVDSDDFVSLNYFEELYNNAINHNADISATFSVLLYPSMKIKNNGISSNGTCIQKTFSKAKERQKMIGWHIVWNKIYRRTFLEKYGIKFLVLPWEDGPFTFMCTVAAHRIVSSENAIYFYRIRENSIMHSSFGKKYFPSVNAVSILENFVRNSKDADFWLPVLKKWVKSSLYSMFYRFGDNQTRKDFCEYVKMAGIDIELPHIYPEVIISFTSYPARIATVAQTAVSLLNQDIPSKKVILWLAESQFPGREADLPENLLALREHGLSIEWCEDIRSYKKLIPALERYPDDIIVTADDDIIYPSDWLRRLVSAYIDQPDMLHCLRAHEVKIKSGNVVDYTAWKHEIEDAKPSFCNFLTSGGGVIFKTSLLHEDLLKKDLFLKLCPDADDIWFWGMAVLKGIKINVVSPPLGKLQYVDGTQEDALWRTNVTQGANDQKLNNLFQHYPIILDRVRHDYKRCQRERLIQRFTQPWIKKKHEGKKEYYLFGLCVFSKKKDVNRKRLSVLGIPLYSYKRIDNKETRRILFIKWTKRLR